MLEILMTIALVPTGEPETVVRIVPLKFAVAASLAATIHDEGIVALADVRTNSIILRGPGRAAGALASRLRIQDESAKDRWDAGGDAQSIAETLNSMLRGARP